MALDLMDRYEFILAGAKPLAHRNDIKATHAVETGKVTCTF